MLAVWIRLRDRDCKRRGIGVWCGVECAGWRAILICWESDELSELESENVTQRKKNNRIKEMHHDKICILLFIGRARGPRA